MFYLASSLPAGREKNKETIRNERLAESLEKHGIKIYLPQRDTDQSMSPRKIFDKNLEAIRNSDGVVLVLAQSRGIYLEAGFAKALGKKVIGLKVDETRNLGTIVRNFLDCIAGSTSELAVILKNSQAKEVIA